MKEFTFYLILTVRTIVVRNSEDLPEQKAKASASTCTPQLKKTTLRSEARIIPSPTEKLTVFAGTNFG